MKIAVEKIKKKEITIEEDVTASSWNMDSFDVKFIDIHLNCEFARAGGEIIVKVKVTARRLIICSRCLEEVSQRVDQEFMLSYASDNLGDYLEVDKDIREEVLLNFPMKVLCRPECKGICVSCGTNLNYQECACYRNILGQKLKIKDKISH